MNSLVEPEVIHALYDASQAGVTVELIVRGVCMLRPGVPGLVGKHPRLFDHRPLPGTSPGVSTSTRAAQENVYLSSADWMERNFFRRIELAFPMLDPS
jgi:polyphosphate kinase